MKELGVGTDWLYQAGDGLTMLGGALTLAVTFVLTWLWQRSGQTTRERVRSSAQEQPAVRAALFIVLLAIAAILPLLIGTELAEKLGTVMIFLLLGLGLNIVVGYAGLFDLGYVAFFAFGAYTWRCSRARRSTRRPARPRRRSRPTSASTRPSGWWWRSPRASACSSALRSCAFAATTWRS